MESDPLANTSAPSIGRLLVDGSGREDIVVRALQECQAAIDAGESIDRVAMIAKYPEIRTELSACLDGLELMGQPENNRDIPAHLAPLATLGDFRIVSEIGRGGMGVVYEAEQLSIGRKVALKVLPYAAMLDKRHIARFQNEARAAATLEHPNIVPVYFVGNERGVYYYAMRLIGGKNLAEVMVELNDASKSGEQLSKTVSSLIAADGPATNEDPGNCPAQADTVRDLGGDVSTHVTTDGNVHGKVYYESIARLGKQVAEALAFAHGYGIIHRDIKPANVMVDEFGDAWVTDFGLARIESDNGMTMTGDLIGTLRYMSPEQTMAKRVNVDHRSDVYSLGATLYELLTLQPLFEAEGRATLLRKVAFEEPKAPSKISASIPHDLETIVLKSLRKNPDDRYETAEEFADDLKRFLSHQPVLARRTPLTQRLRMWTKRHPAMFAATAIVCVVSLFSTAAIGLLVAKHERDARTQQETATEEIANALHTAKTNLSLANEERRRAEANLSLAIQAVEETYLNSIGEDRLLRIGVRTEFTPPLEAQKLLTAPPLSSSGVRFSQAAQRPAFSDEERDVVQRGLEFYDQIASLNPTNPQTQFQSAKAFSRLALLHGGLGENAEAKVAYEEAISRLKSLTHQVPDSAAYFSELARAYYQQGRLNSWWPDAEGTFDEAIAAATKAIQIAPDQLDAYRLRGRAHLCLHQYELASKDFEKVVDADTDSAAAHYELSQTLEEANDLKKAASHLKKSVALDPANANYRIALASLYKFGLKDKESAGALFEPLLQVELAPKDEAEVRAKQSFFKGPPRDVIKYVDKFNELGGESFETYYWRARAHRWQKKHELATADLQSAFRLALTDQDFHDVALEYHKLGNVEQAIAAWGKAEELNSNNYEFFKDRGLVLYNSGKYVQAATDLGRFLRIVPNKKSFGYLYQHLARLNFLLGRYVQSLQFIETSIELNPTDLSVVNSINDVYHPTTFDPPEFRIGFHALMQKTVERYTSHIQEDSRFEYWHNRATAYLELGRVDEAIADYLQAVQLKPEANYSWTMLAASYRKKGLYKESVATHAKAVKLDPDDALHRIARAETHKHFGNFQEALEDFRSATRIAPEDMKAWFRLGVLLAEAGQFEKAIDAYTVVIEEKSFHHNALINRGNAYKKLRQFRNAIVDYSKAIDLNTEHPYGWRNRGHVYLQLGQFQNAVDDSTFAIELRPDLPEGWHNRGIAFFKLGQYEEAIADFSKATELGDHKALGPHAYTLWKLDQADDAVPLLHKYLQFEKKEQKKRGSNLDVDMAVIESLRNLGYVQMSTNQVADAFDSFQEAAQLAKELKTIAPENPTSWTLLGRAQHELGNLLSSHGDRASAFAAFELAKSALERSLEVDSHPSRLCNLANFLVNCSEKSLRDPEEALRLANLATRQAGAKISPRARNDLKTIVGLAHFQLGEWQKALGAVESITESKAVEHRYFIAMTHWKLDNENVARKKLAEAIAADDGVRSKDDPPYDVMAGWDRARRDAQELIGVKLE